MVSDSATPWTVALHASLSMEFSRQECWSGSPVFFSRESSWPRDKTQVSCIAGGFFTVWATRKAQIGWACHEFKFLIISWITEVLFSSVLSKYFSVLKNIFPFYLETSNLCLRKKNYSLMNSFIYWVVTVCQVLNYYIWTSISYSGSMQNEIMGPLAKKINVNVKRTTEEH